MLARIQQDPDWWRKRDEEKRHRQKEQQELEAKLAGMGIHPFIPTPITGRKLLSAPKNRLRVRSTHRNSAHVCPDHCQSVDGAGAGAE
jgi:hypothetical protein